MAEPEEHVQERFTVPPELEGQRADAAVAALTGLSRSAPWCCSFPSRK